MKTKEWKKDTTLNEYVEDALGDGAVAKQRVACSTRHHMPPYVQPASSTVDEVTAACHQRPGARCHC